MEILKGSYYHKDEQIRRTQTAGPLERFSIWNWIPALSECKRTQKDSKKSRQKLLTGNSTTHTIQSIHFTYKGALADPAKRRVTR